MKTQQSIFSAFAFSLCAFAAPLTSAAPEVVLKVVINEFSYDDAGIDDQEFVELFNAGTVEVDLGNWTVGGFDQSGANQTITIPPGTSLVPGAFYVIGNVAVPNLNQVAPGGFLENDQEAIQLKDANGTLMDEVAYELNKGLSGISEGGLWGNHVMQGVLGVRNSTAYARYVDGLDTDVNSRDFGMRQATPGSSNHSGGVNNAFVGPDVDALSDGEEAPGYHGSFVSPRAIDPMSTSATVGANILNPNPIPRSPQGGNALIMWDPAGGGNTAGSEFTIGADGFFDIFVYIDPTLPIGTDTEEWGVGLAGTEDPTFQNLFDAGANGSTGLGWVFQRNSSVANLRLIDFGAGGPPANWTVLGIIELDASQLGWHRLGIRIEGTDVTGTFDATTIAGTTTAGHIGNFWMAYREAFANNSQLRPLTIDLTVPALTIRRVGDKAVICWPTSAAGFSLQFSTDLNSADNWMNSMDTPAIVGDNYYVTNNLTGSKRFYRLAQGAP